MINWRKISLLELNGPAAMQICIYNCTFMCCRSIYLNVIVLKKKDTNVFQMPEHFKILSLLSDGHSRKH